MNNESTEYNLGPQPLDEVLKADNITNHDLVAAGSTEFLTHKMVAKGRKGRRLTRNVQTKILNALNKVSGKTFTLEQLFNYRR